ncbi:GPI transamidase subunit PIG-U [Plasmodiophora brassicae]|nr:hypothetical protein PBRA_001844 [Plasmodiophora brassicae]
MITELVLGAALRAALMAAGSAEMLSNAVELVGPTTSYRRVQEALYLNARHLSIYDGDVFHQPPLVFELFSALESIGLRALVPGVFIAIDVIIAVLFHEIARMNNTFNFPLTIKVPNRAENMNSSSGMEYVVLLVYLFNPLTVLSCAAMSTSLLTHLFAVMSIYLAFRGRPTLLGFCIAAATYLELHSAFLIIPGVLLLHFGSVVQPMPTTAISTDHDADRIPDLPRFAVNPRILTCIISALLWYPVLVVLSTAVYGSWEWISHSYKYVFAVMDLSPNIGVFWYFETEIFNRFRTFFLVCFHAHVLVYLIPLTVRFWHNPLFLGFVCAQLANLFQSYPVLGDYGISYPLLLTQWAILKKMRPIIPVYVGLLISCTLGHMTWFLWIHAGSGNANFYYNQTLVWGFCNGFLVIEAVSAVRTLYTLADPSPPPTEHDGADQSKAPVAR